MTPAGALRRETRHASARIGQREIHAVTKIPALHEKAVLRQGQGVVWRKGKLEKAPPSLREAKRRSNPWGVTGGDRRQGKVDCFAALAMTGKETSKLT
jgi:hypothetical protein